MSRFADAVQRRTILFDGAMGTSIHARDLDLDRDYLGKENCTEILVQTRPDVIQDIHEDFLKVGSDAVETDTFGANTLVLAEFELQDQTRKLNREAAEVARAACEAHSTADKPRFVIGSMGPGTKLITLGNTDWESMFASYREQARGLIDGGVDAFLIETSQDILQVKCAVNAVLAALDEAGKSHTDIPIMVQVTIETTGTMLLGTEISAAAHTLQRFPIFSLGMNCATGPTEMAEHVAWLGRYWDRPMSVLPNAGLPTLVEGRTEYPLRPTPFAEAMSRFIEEHGVGIVGGCCGTTPEHLQRLSEAIESHKPGARGREPMAPSITSLYSPVEMRQDASLLNVGERLNASGSRAFKRLLEDEDWDEMISLARGQMREGSHVLDVNVDYAGRDNARDMYELVHRLVRQVAAPLMIDSTQPATIEAGLKAAGGKCIINSANLEDGEEKFAELCALAKRYGAALVLGTIDEDPEEAMARTADRKISIARRMHQLATETYGLDEADIFFDPLVLPISTGMDKDRRSALETIEGVRRISTELPNCQTCVGLSNVSFGLNPVARQVLNSAFLHELREAGLTSAILHASKILPQTKIEERQWAAAMDLIYDRRPAEPVTLEDGTKTTDPLQIFVDLFPADAKVASSKQDLSELPIEQRLQQHIIDGEKKNLAETLDEAMTTYAPLDIINDHLLAGMKVVGELFGSGQMQLPFVLQSAEVMKMAVAHLEPHMEKADGQTKGTIVLATVKGDVHDIGKNLVDIILTNNGYTVYNIGIKQPISAIIEKWRETKADAIGLSGLLVKSVNVMEQNLHELNEQAIDVPVILGGAALARHYCESHLRNIYQGECLYGKDAFDGLRVMDLITTDQLSVLDEEIAARLAKRAETDAKLAAKKQAELEADPIEVEAGEPASASSPSSPEPAAAPSETRPTPEADRDASPERQLEPAAVAVADAPATERHREAVTGRRRSDVQPVEVVPEAPFWGDRVVEGIRLDDVYPFINPVALFRGQWQFKKGRMDDATYDAHLEDQVYPIFENLKARCRDEQLLTPKVVYGYYPVQSEGEDLVVYDPAAFDRDRSLNEVERFTFPRQNGKKRLCISDFFRDRDSGEVDVLGMSCVTVGEEVSEEARKLFEGDRYTDYLYLHGFGVETAEALAEYWHKRMRQEMGVAGDDSPRIRELFTQHYRGSRYSFGYPACPDMSDQEKLFRLLQPERIGCQLTENWQIDPEQSTSAIIVHHPAAKYFNI